MVGDTKYSFLSGCSDAGGQSLVLSFKSLLAAKFAKNSSNNTCSFYVVCGFYMHGFEFVIVSHCYKIVMVSSRVYLNICL